MCVLKAIPATSGWLNLCELGLTGQADYRSLTCLSYGNEKESFTGYQDESNGLELNLGKSDIMLFTLPSETDTIPDTRW